MAHNKPRAKISADTLHQLKIKCDYECICCGVREDEGMKLVPNHIRSLAQGGSDDISNLQLLCWNCNNIKRDKELDFRATAWYYDKADWSSAESSVRMYMLTQDRSAAFHRDYVLPTQMRHLIELWESRDYFFDEMMDAIDHAEELGYSYLQ